MSFAAAAPAIGAGISALGSVFGKKKKSGDPKYLKAAKKSAISRAEMLSRRSWEGFTGDRVAGLGENEIMAGGMARDFGSGLQPFRDRLAAGFSPGALSQYENPYLDRVLTARQRVIGEEFGRQSSALARRQSAMDTFRSGRSDLARSRLDYNRMQALDDAEGEARAGAFDRAMSAFQNQQNLDVGALGAVGQSQIAQIGALSQTGATERSLRQGAADFNYGQFLEQRDWDVNNMGPLLDAIRAASGSGSGGTSGGSTAAGLAGLLGTIVGNLPSGGGGDNLQMPSFQFDVDPRSIPINTGVLGG